jgi:hypothetical protein
MSIKLDEIINRDFYEGTIQQSYDNCNRQINIINQQLNYYNYRIRVKLFNEYGPRWYRRVENTNKDNQQAYNLRCEEKIKMIYPDDVIPQDEINLAIHKFGKQHRTGNHLIIIGGLLTGIGSITLYNSLSNKELYGKQDNPNIYKTIIGLGSGLLVTGFIINIDSFRHLK